MRRTLLIVVALVLILCALALAQVCPPADPGYVRQPRPQGVTPNYPPAEEPACFQRGTNEAASYISCTMCHYHLWRIAA